MGSVGVLKVGMQGSATKSLLKRSLAEIEGRDCVVFCSRI